MNYLPIKEYADTKKKIKSESDNSHTIVKDILYCYLKKMI